MKVLIFSHESDIDGLGCVVLGKMAFGEIDYVLSPGFKELEPKFREYLDSGKIYEYDKIFVTDLALYNPSLSRVYSDPNLKNKVLIFDHHAGSLAEGCGVYDFETIAEIDKEGIKTCGTRLFYEYLCVEGFLEPTNALNEFVELTRLEDVWEWKNAKEKGIKAHDLAILFNSLGSTEAYINCIYNKMLNGLLKFTEEEAKIIQNKKDEYDRLLSGMMSEAEYFNDEFGNFYGIVYASYEYRNELSEYVRRKNNPYNIDYLIIVALDKGANGQKSYRSIKDVDVNIIALAHGGGGHPAASSVNITETQKAKSLTLSRKDALKYLADSKYEV